MTERTSTAGWNTSRRAFLLGAGVVGSTTLAGCSASTAGDRTETTSSRTETAGDRTGTAPPTSTGTSTPTGHSSPELEKWVDEVPRPGVVEPTGTTDGRPQYEIEMREIEQKVHRDLPATTLWGYDGQYPGPTIEAEQGEPIHVRWKNELPDDHILPVDTTVHDEIIPYEAPDSRVVTHLHGGNTEAESDGRSQAWFTRGFETTGPEFTKQNYYYNNDQPPAALWYHDHALGITRLNVYAGLAGFYVLRNDHERSLGLPDGEYEIPLVIQDRSFEPDGSLYYPTGENGSGDGSSPDPSVVPHFYGDTPVVNGKAWPRLTVEPGPYRFRLLNGSNSRFYHLKLFSYDEETGEPGDEGPSFVQIGNDGGLLPEPVTVGDRLELASGQRADVVVDFSAHAGETLLLHNDAPAMYRGATGDDAGGSEPLPEIMLIEVSDTGGEDNTGQVPETLTQVPDIPADSADTQRYLTLAKQTDERGRDMYLLGTEAEPAGKKLTEPITEKPVLGNTEIWSVANFTAMSHPVHLHLVHFQVLGRQPGGSYDPDEGEIDVDALEAPEPYERGWKDVVTVDPGEVVHLIAHFGEYEGLFNDQTGEYMWHCHMLEHEDYDMMRTFSVRPESGDDGSATE
jgi:spore coat protein A